MSVAKLESRFSGGAVSGFTVRATTRLSLFSGLRKAKMSAMSAARSPCTPGASAWSAPSAGPILSSAIAIKAIPKQMNSTDPLTDAARLNARMVNLPLVFERHMAVAFSS